MRRALVLTAVFGAFLAGLGCRHVGGRCDCTNNDADAVIPAPHNPYPVLGQPVAGPSVGVVTPVAPATLEKMPMPPVPPMPR